MARKKLLKSKKLPYHIFGRSNNKEWFYIQNSEVWEICLDKLFTTTVVYGLRVHAFVLMQNHFHLLASTPDGNLGMAMNYFMREVSREINRRSGRSNHIFGGAYKASIIRDPHYYFSALRYVYQNPMRAKICNRAQDYLHSSLRIIFGEEKRALPLYPSAFEGHFPITEKDERFLNWLNGTRKRSTENAISAGLRKTVFKLPIERKSRAMAQIPSDQLKEIDALLNQK